MLTNTFVHDYWNTRTNTPLVVRFPPEPNGALHIGHAKALLLNNDLALHYNGTLNLRMDDTNPKEERAEFEEMIKRDTAWLGATVDKFTRASDVFDDLAALARKLIAEGLAYTDVSNASEVAARKRPPNEAEVASPNRTESASVHRERFEKMLRGEYPVGSCVLRAKWDLGSPHMIKRDPILWRVVEHRHPHKSEWAALPMYDFAHPFTDVCEGIGVSLCSLEFETRRPLYDWVAAHAVRLGFGAVTPVELEFARMELDCGFTSKRKIKKAIEDGAVRGWDDPRLLTIAGLRAKGVPAAAVRALVERAGISRALSTVPLEWLNEEARELGKNAPAVWMIEHPVELRIEGMPETVLDVPYNKNDESLGARPLHFGENMVVDASDVSAMASSDFFRLAVGNHVRLMGCGAIIEVVEVKEKDGRPVLVRAKLSERTKAKATIHALHAKHARPLSIHTIEWWDGESASNDCWTTVSGVMEETPWSNHFVHAVRMGFGAWLNEDPSNGWVKTCAIRPSRK